MFDIGFSELIVCGIVALIVIGPERMPEAVRTVGLWIGRVKRSLRETRSEIERQIGVDDIRRQLHNEDIMRSLEDARRDMDNAIAQTQEAIDSTAETIYKSEPDLPYHSHTEENTALENIVETVAETEEDNSNLLTEILDSSLEKRPQAETKVEIDKKSAVATASAISVTPATQVVQTSQPATPSHTTSSDTKAAL